MTKVLLPVALALGLVIAVVDSRPNWDDSGITAMAILIVSGVFGMLSPDRPWIWGLALGLWIPVYGIVTELRFAPFLVLAFSFAGAYMGMAFAKMFRRPEWRSQRS